MTPPKNGPESIAACVVNCLKQRYALQSTAVDDFTTLRRLNRLLGTLVALVFKYHDRKWGRHACMLVLSLCDPLPFEQLRWVTPARFVAWVLRKVPCSACNETRLARKLARFFTLVRPRLVRRVSATHSNEASHRVQNLFLETRTELVRFPCV